MSDPKYIESGPIMSQAVTYNGTAYLAGQVAIDSHEAEFATQAAEIFKRIDTQLAAAGTDKSRLLAATVWITDLANFAQFNEAWTAWLDGNPAPARATVRADLVLPGLLLEIQVTAAL